ncbi:MAG: DNA-directed RNA polymerase, subunit E'' [Aeropyrum sp.]|nr:DNA-directed RNA polymerase, subunit E'' [Aeropyrum sp.]MCE4616223.1 DNA-directed RNA polymerase, subunit E'' [Aeropyrum sp.]
MARKGGRSSSFIACKNCGALLPKGTQVCPECGSSQLSENWSGIIIVLDPENSLLAKEFSIDKPAMKAIMIGKKVVVRGGG